MERTGPGPEKGGPGRTGAGQQVRKGDRSRRWTEAGLQDLLVVVGLVLPDAPGPDSNHPAPQPPAVLLGDSGPQQTLELRGRVQVLLGPCAQVVGPALQQGALQCFLQGEARFQSGCGGGRKASRRLLTCCRRWCERISRAWILASSFMSSTS